MAKGSDNTKELEKENEKVKKELADSKRADESLAEKLNGELSSMSDTCKNLSDDNAKCQAERIEELKNFEATLEKYKKQDDDAMKELKIAKDIRIEDKKRIKELEEHNELLVKEYKKTGEEESFLRKENYSLKKQIADLESARVSNCKHLDELKDENLKLRLESVDLKKNMAELEATKVSEITEKQKTRIAELEHDKQVLEKRLRRSNTKKRPGGMK